MVGNGEYGQLGCGFKSDKEEIPIKIKFDKSTDLEIKQVCCGLRHTGFLTGNK